MSHISGRPASFPVHSGVSWMMSSLPTKISAMEMEPERLKAHDELCFHSGIDLQRVLSQYVPEDVIREVEPVIVQVENILPMFPSPCKNIQRVSVTGQAGLQLPMR